MTGFQESDPTVEGRRVEAFQMATSGARVRKPSSFRVARYPDTASRRDWTNHESYNQAGPRPDQVESLASTSRVERLEVTDSPRRRPEFPAVRSTRSRSALARTNPRRPARSSQPIVRQSWLLASQRTPRRPDPTYGAVATCHSRRCDG